jgi:hypothetical protein
MNLELVGGDVRLAQPGMDMAMAKYIALCWCIIGVIHSSPCVAAEGRSIISPELRAAPNMLK